MKKNDYRSIDIGIVAAYITAEACDQGLATCILGWLNEKKLKELLSIKEGSRVRLVIAIGFANDKPLREKKRKSIDQLVTEIN